MRLFRLFVFLYFVSSNYSFAVNLNEAADIWKNILKENLLYDDVKTKVEDPINLLILSPSTIKKGVKSLKTAKKLPTLFLAMYAHINNILKKNNILTKHLDLNYKSSVREFLKNLEAYNAMLALATNIKDIFINLNIECVLCGDLEIYMYIDNTIALGLIEIDDILTPVPFVFDKNLVASPRPLIDRLLNQFTSLTYNNEVVSDYGFYLENHDGRIFISLYSGKFSRVSPFSILPYNHWSPSFNFSYEEWKELYGANFNSEKELGFISLYSNKAEQIGFLAEFKESLALTTIDCSQPDLIDYDQSNLEPNVSTEIDLLIQEEWEIRKKWVIDSSINATKNTTKNSRKSNKNSKHRKKSKQQKSKNKDIDTSIDDILNSEYAKLNSEIDAKMNQGRLKFRKVSQLVNKLINQNNINIHCEQHGSHIVLSAKNCSPITVVKKHGRNNTICLKEAQDILEKVLEVANAAAKNSN